MNSLLFRAAHDLKVGHVVFFSCSIMYPSKNRPQTETDFDHDQELHPRYFGADGQNFTLKRCASFTRGWSHPLYGDPHSNIYGPYDKFDLGAIACIRCNHH